MSDNKQGSKETCKSYGAGTVVLHTLIEYQSCENNKGSRDVKMNQRQQRIESVDTSANKESER